jgi:DNA-binding NtrC family response regulator
MKFSPEAMRALVQARWEGNVRELRNLVESLVVLTPTLEIGLGDLPEEFRRAGSAEPLAATTAGPAAGPRDQRAHDGGANQPAGPTMEEIERRAILEALERTGGNRTQAAEMLGIGLRTLQRKLKEYKVAGYADLES